MTDCSGNDDHDLGGGSFSHHGPFGSPPPWCHRRNDCRGAGDLIVAFEKEEAAAEFTFPEVLMVIMG